jgi:hypothetical protein
MVQHSVASVHTMISQDHLETTFQGIYHFLLGLFPGTLHWDFSLGLCTGTFPWDFALGLFTSLWLRHSEKSQKSQNFLLPSTSQCIPSTYTQSSWFTTNPVHTWYSTVLHQYILCCSTGPPWNDHCTYHLVQPVTIQENTWIRSWMQFTKA